MVISSFVLFMGTFGVFSITVFMLFVDVSFLLLTNSAFILYGLALVGLFVFQVYFIAFGAGIVTYVTSLTTTTA